MLPGVDGFKLRTDDVLTPICVDNSHSLLLPIILLLSILQNSIVCFVLSDGFLEFLLLLQDTYLSLILTI